MLNSTKEKYRKNAQGFIKKHFDRQTYPDNKLLNILIDVAPNYTARSFANLKLALSFFLKERGKEKLASQIKEIQNPCVNNNTTKKRRLKKKTLNTKEMKAITDAITNKNKRKKEDPPLTSAYILARILGARPSEMQNITQTSGDTFLILGSKKSANGNRGLDRHIRVNKDLCRYITKAITAIQKDNIDRVQDRFNYLMAQTFKRKKIKPTLYTLRHQFCSELKSSEISILEIAYLMGHQSTRTMENYGYANAGSGRVSVEAAVSAAAIGNVVRDTQKIRNIKRASRINNLKTASQKRPLPNISR